MYQTDSKCIFQGGGCSEGGEISNAYGTGDELRAKFNELSEICETPLQEYKLNKTDIYGKPSYQTVYLHNPGNGKQMLNPILTNLMINFALIVQNFIKLNNISQQKIPQGFAKGDLIFL